MDWANERYVRLYTRDTGDWLMWPWQTRALFCFILRKVDRAGLLHLGKGELNALAAIVGVPSRDVTEWIAPLLEDGCVQVNGDTLCVPNFIDAQETPQSDKARQRQSRERARDKFVAAMGREPSAKDLMAIPEGPSHAVTLDLTDCHAPSHAVTASHSVPSLTVPSLANDGSANALTESETTRVRKLTKHRARTALDESWEPPSDEHAHSWHQEARKHGLTVAEVSQALAEFKLHYAANGELRADWLASWRLWLSRVRRYGSVAKLERGNGVKQQAALPGEHDWSVAARAKAKVV